jgi:hypothetical protein
VFPVGYDLNLYMLCRGKMHKAFHMPYVYHYIIKSCRQQAEVIQNHENGNVRYIRQGDARHTKYKRLKLGGGHVYNCSSD